MNLTSLPQPKPTDSENVLRDACADIRNLWDEIRIPLEAYHSKVRLSHDQSEVDLNSFLGHFIHNCYRDYNNLGEYVGMEHIDKRGACIFYYYQFWHQIRAAEIILFALQQEEKK